MTNTKRKIGKIIILIILIILLVLVLAIGCISLYINYKGNFKLNENPLLTTGLAVAGIFGIILLFFLLLTHRKDNNEGDYNSTLAKEFEHVYKGIKTHDGYIKSKDFVSDLKEGSTTLTELNEDGSIVNVNVDIEVSQEVENEAEEEVETKEASRFYMLTQIDERFKGYKDPKYDDHMSLNEICEDFRAFCSSRCKLYYDIEDIRRFIAGLSVTKLIILQGMSGTGKTSLAYAFGEYLENKTVVVPIQPMWKERTDLIGYYNEFTKKFNETTLLYKMYEANYNKNIYITVLDEMNIARVEYYFAEFLSLLELPNPDSRNLDVVSDKWENDPVLLVDGKLRLPINMWFIGTANNDDSTFAISDKVYDRAMVLNLDKKAQPFEAEYVTNKHLSSDRLYELFKEAQLEYKLSKRNERRIRMLDEFMIKNFHLTFGNRIMKQITSYVPVLVACGGTELEALDDILARKVFRKLESKNPIYVKQLANTVCDYLDELFGDDKLPLCKEVIRLIEQNV